MNKQRKTNATGNLKPSDKAAAKNNVRAQQPSKDSKTKRVNYDNTRVQKYYKDVRKQINEGKVATSNNDIDWYTKNPTLLARAASFPVASIVGDNVAVTGSNYRGVPGILSFGWVPAYGPDEVALTQCADSLYSFTVHANSRNGSYDGPDLLIGILAGSEVFNILGAMIRAYGFAKTYMEYNRYVPDAVLQAMGFLPTFKEDLGKVIFDINLLIAQTRQLWVPNTMPIIDKHFKLNSLVYKDADNDRAQVYVFTQNLYKAFSAKEIQTGSALLPVRLNSDGEPSLTDGVRFMPSAKKQYSWSTWVQVAQFMINQLVSMQDRGIMYGDILMAFGSDKIKALPEIGIDYRVEPVYNAEIQMQVENIVTSSYVTTALFQSDNFVRPSFEQQGVSSQYLPSYAPALLNFHVSDVTPSDITIATRFITAGLVNTPYKHLSYSTSDAKYTIVGTAANRPDTVSTETICLITMLIFNAPVSGSSVSVSDIDQFITTESGSLVNSSVTAHLQLMAFDWHPFLYEMTNLGGEAPQVINYYGDFDNYTLVPKYILSNLNTACLYSLLDIPIL